MHDFEPLSKNTKPNVRRNHGTALHFLFVRLSNLTYAALACLAVASVPTAAQTDEKAQLRFRYAVSFRNGTEADLGPGLSYSGLTPNDVSLVGWLWFLVGDHVGVTGAVHREAFSLRENNDVVTSGALLRAHVSATGRLRLGPARLEAQAGYLFQQLPVFGTVDSPQFGAVQRHGLLLGARALVDWSLLTVEGRFEYPLALAHTGPRVRSSGVGAGGALRVQLFRTGPVKWGLLADVQWNQDSVSSLDDTALLNTTQNAVRVGLAVDVQWKDPASELQPTTGRVRIVVRRDGRALNGARVLLARTTNEQLEAQTDSDGAASFPDVAAGEWTVEATLAGYERQSSQVAVVAGSEVQSELQLRPEAPKVGSLAVRVVARDDSAPLAAEVTLDEQTASTDGTGLVSFSGLMPGPKLVKAVAEGYVSGQEAATVVAGKTAELTVTLVREKQRVPAVIRGHVRSARGGRPVAAKLDIRELKQVVTVGEDGSFSAEVPGGTYTIRIAAPNFVTQTKSLVVRDGDQTILNVDLVPK